MPFRYRFQSWSEASSCSPGSGLSHFAERVSHYLAFPQAAQATKRAAPGAIFGQSSRQARVEVQRFGGRSP
jgi:hypothetical protein